MIFAPVRAELDGAEVVPLSVQLEAEAAQLDPDERRNAAKDPGNKALVERLREALAQEVERLGV